MIIKNLFNINIMKQLFYYLSAAVLATTMLSCSNDGDKPYSEIQMPAQTRALVVNNNDFSFDLLNREMERDDRNIAISPFSVYTTLAMLANGDNDIPRQEILEVLRIQSNEIEDLNSFVSLMLAKLPHLDNRTQINIKNSLWADPEINLNQDFSSCLSKNFDAEIIRKSPGGETGKLEVNKWISDATNGKIPNFLTEPFDEMVKMMVANALYFKGKWSDPFKKENTKKRTFHNQTGGAVSTDFMHRRESQKYYSNDYCSLTTLEYGNGNFAMTIALPNEGVSVEELSSKLNSQLIQTYLKEAWLPEVDLYLPKFEIITQTDLIDVLESMGIKEMFWPNTGLNSISTINFCVGAMMHGVTLSVDENGTVAAAAAVAPMTPTSPGHAVMNVDRPFIFFISEQSTGTILFNGCVRNL